jgi:molybdate transport system permease protein
MEIEALRLSLYVALRSVALGLPLAIVVAYLLSRSRFLGRTLLDAIVHLPLVLPPVVVGYVLLLVFGTRGALGGWLESAFGIRLAFTSAGAALATAVMTFPLMVRAIRLSLEAIDPRLEDAARTLGAGPIDRFWTITLPLMAPRDRRGRDHRLCGRSRRVRCRDHVRLQHPGRDPHAAPRAVHGAAIAGWR